jgi:hypothetical protein
MTDKEALALMKKAIESPEGSPERMEALTLLGPISAEEAAELLAQPSDPRMLRRFDELVGQNRAKIAEEEPTLIVGGTWPGKVPGSRRDVCADCLCFVSLSPRSGDAAHKKYPSVPIVCFSCAEKRANRSPS